MHELRGAVTTWLPPYTRRRLKLIVVVSTILTLAAVGFLRFADLYSRSGRILANGDRRAHNLATILARYIAEALGQSDAALRQIASFNVSLGGARGSSAAWQTTLASARSGVNTLGSLSIVDRDGIVRHSTRAEIVGESRENEYVFRSLATGTSTGLTVSPPFRALFGSKRELFIPIGRRLSSASGQFDGVAVAMFLPDSLRDVFRAVDTGRDGMVTVYHTEGVVLFREPSTGNPIGDRVAGDPRFVFGERSGDGTVRTRGAGAHALRTGVASVPGFPVFVAVSLSETELLATVNQDMRASAIALIVLAAVGAVGVGALFRLMARGTAMAAAIGRSQHLEVLGRLTGGVAHDFNNLLAVIQGYASLIVIDPNSPTRELDQESLGEIRSAAARAAGLTKQLLAFARRQPLQPQRVSIGQVVRSMEAMLARTVGEDIELRIIVRDACETMLDPVQLDTAILNLVVNARHAMPKGGALIIEAFRTRIDPKYVRENPDASSGEFCCVSVADTGTGIPSDLLPRLFEPFFTTKPPSEGTGLGLSMVYGFVRQSGGHAKVYSELGHGTTVKLYFPSIVDDGEVQGVSIPEAPHGRGEVILLVEDDKAVRRSATRNLESLGYVVHPAEDAATAVVLARRYPEINLLFTDVVLAGPLSGLELALRLRRLRPGIPVLYTSGYSEEVLQHRTGSPEPLRLLRKPYDISALALAVHEALVSTS